MQKKKYIIPMVCITLLFGTMVYQTFAYFTKESTTTNEISTGYLEMNLEERIKADGLTWDLKYPWDYLEENQTYGPVSIMPGDTVPQEPYVQNVEAEDFYCRVSYDMNIVDKNGEPLPSDVVTVNIDTDKWVLDEEGWYRYVDIVTAKGTEADTTAPLFTEVHFSTEMDNRYIGCIVTIIVDSQSVQSDYNQYDTSIGETVLDVKGFADLAAKGKGGIN